MNRKVLVAFVVGLLASGIPLAAFTLFLMSEVNRLGSIKGVSLAVDKDSYALGEIIKITLENKFDRELFVFTFDFFELQRKDGSWMPVYNHALPEYLLKAYQGMVGVAQAQSVAGNTSLIVSWNQTMVRLSYVSATPYPTPMLNYSQLSAGEYRLKMTISLRYGSLEGAMPENSFEVYSNQFAVR
jgi:hypothetical protein